VGEGIFVSDEGAAYEEAREELMSHGHAFGTAFGGVFLEGLEVVFIVVALGGLNSVPAASAGAIASLLVVGTAGVVARRPLTRVPENLVKYAVGVMLTAFGTFFAGEGLGVGWWHGDLVLLALIPGYAAASVVLVALMRWRPGVGASEVWPLRMLSGAVREVWGLFVTDGLLAASAVAVLLFIPVYLDRFHGDPTNAGLILAGGVALAVAIAVRRASSATGRGREPAANLAVAPQADHVVEQSLAVP